MARTNACLNPAAKNNLADWFETGPAPAGTDASRVTGLTGMDRTTGVQLVGDGATQFLIALGETATAAGTSYDGLPWVVSPQFRIDGGAESTTVHLLWLDASQSVIGEVTSSAATADGAADRLWVAGTAPAGTEQIACQVDLVASASFTLTATAVLIEQTSEVEPAFFDGDSPDASWDGADGNSTSTLTEAVTGSLSGTLPTLTGSFTGTSSSSSATGALDGTLPALTGSLSGTVGDTETVRQNLCDNPALHNNTTGWTGGTREATTDLDRDWCYRIAADSRGEAPTTTASAGQTWTMSVWARCQTGMAQTWLAVDERSSSGGFLTSQGDVFTLTEDWRRFHGTITVQRADTTDVLLAAENQDDTAYIEITKVLYEQTDTLAQYGDGDSPSWVWDGAAGNSTSSLLLAAGEEEPEPEFDPDADLKAAIAAQERVILSRILVDWDRDGTWDHEVSDLTPWLTSVSVSSAITGDLPEEASLVEGSAASTLSATLGGVSPYTGADPTGDGLDALEVFSAHRTDSPLWRTATVGAPLVYDIGVVTDSGVRWERQFTGTVRSIRPDSRGRSVQLAGIDHVDSLRTAVTLPAYGLSRSDVLGSGHEVLTTNSQWVIDHCLRRNGIYASPPAIETAQIAATGHGSLAAEVGRNAVPRGEIGVDVGDESWWVSGPFGMLAARGPWQNPHALYQEFFTRESYRPVAGNGVGIGIWLRIGDDMTDVSDAANRPIIQLFPLTDHDAFDLTLSIYDTGSVGGHINGSGFAQPVSVTTQWQYVGLHFQHNDDGTTRIRYRVAGATTFGDVTTPALTASIAQRMHATHWQYRDWANMQVWFDHDPPAGDWPGEVHSPQATLDRGANELQYLPDVVEQDAWSVIQQVAQAEYALARFDEFGVFRLTSRGSITTSPNSVEKEVTADLDLLDLASEVNIDGVRNIVTTETAGGYLSFDQSIIDSDDELQFESPVGVWTYEVALEHGAIGSTTQTLTQHTTTEWQDNDPLEGFVAVQSASPEVEVTSGVTVTFSMTGDRRGQIKVSNFSAFPVRFATTSGSPALRVQGWALVEQPAQTETITSDGSVEVYGARPYPIPASPWRQLAEPLRDVAGGLLATLANPLPVIDGVRTRGDPTLRLAHTVRMVDEQGIGPAFRATVIKLDREHSGGLTDQIAVRPIVSPGLGLLDDNLLGVLDSTLVLAP